MSGSTESTPLSGLAPHYGSNDSSQIRRPGNLSTTITQTTESQSIATDPVKSDKKLNTFNGVFVPTTLNILSILMFLRFGFIIGQMGILGSFGLLLLSYLINSLTVMSISAIATNGTVKGGGAYYMISRSLGPEFGGAIGIIFYVGQILNSSLNVVGLIEPILVNFGKMDGDLFQLLPVSYWWQLLYSTALLAFCTGIALVGSNMVSKTALWLFIILTFATLSIPFSSFYSKVIYYDETYSVGISWEIFKQNLLPHFTKGAAGSVQDSPETFRNLFGIFFPATSGIFAGASMSGELKSPSKSIPAGTIKGLILSFVLYAIVILSIGWSVPRELLHKDIKIIQTINLQGYIIILGELATSLFSIIMGVVGAASLLTAISNDRIIPGLTIFATNKKTKGDFNKARFYGIFITWFLAQIFLLADINQIAVFVTMAYLMTFIVTNLACFLLKLGSAPNFRPSFKYFNIQTAFMGLISATVAMFIVDGMSAVIVITLLLIFILLIHYSTPPSKFGDISQLLIYHQVRKYLLRLKVNMNVKYWRPQILLLVDSPRTSWNLIGFCNHLKKGGLYILGHVVILNDDTISRNVNENDSEFSITAYKEVQKQKKAWIKLRDMAKVKAFVQIAMGPSLPWGVRNVYLGSGLGGMKPNITVLGFYDFVKHGLQMPMPLSSFKSKSQFEQLPTDDCREEQQVSINQWVQIIEDLIIMQSSVAVAANFNSLKLPKFTEDDTFWSKVWPKKKPKTEEATKKYIDLYPIQMSSINVIDGKSVLSTNFDTYTLILQLGSILSTVPEWKRTNHRLRIIVFVEDKSEVEDEKQRLSDLLKNLRIDAKLKAICLNDGSLNSYNYIVKGWQKNSSNKVEYDKIDRALKNDQWWKNLCNARDALNQIEKQKLKKMKSKAAFSKGEFTTLGLNRSNSNPTGKGGRNRRDTISNLHGLGLSLSFNMKGGLLDYDKNDVESYYSSDDDDDDDDDGEEEDVDYNVSANSTSTNIAPVVSESGKPNNPRDKPSKKFNLTLDLSGKTGHHLSSDQLSVKSSRSNLRPNFVSIKTPAAQLNDDEDDVIDAGEDEDGAGKPSIGFVDDGQTSRLGSTLNTPNEKDIKEDKGDYFSLAVEKKKDSISRLRQGERPPLKSPSIISNDDGIIQQLRTPQFLAADDDDGDIPSLSSSTTNLPALNSPRVVQSANSAHRKEVYKKNASTFSGAQTVQNSVNTSPSGPSVLAGEAGEDKVITHKQLQQELKELSFDDIPAKGQHIILNELMKLYSPAYQTDVIFSTLPAPSLNTHLDDDESFEYTNNLSLWLHELQPTILFNSQTVTVTTAL